MKMIPVFEPEVFAAAKARFHATHPTRDDFDWADKVPTTAVRELVIDGVKIGSRYQKANELQALSEIVSDLPPALRKNIKDVFFDSKGMWITVTLRRWAVVETTIGHFQRGMAGRAHAGIVVEGPNKEWFSTCNEGPPCSHE
jgi:hypothetical protein